MLHIRRSADYRERDDGDKAGGGTGCRGFERIPMGNLDISGMSSVDILHILKTTVENMMMIVRRLILVITCRTLSQLNPRLHLLATAEKCSVG